MATVYPGIQDAVRVLSERGRCYVVTSKRKDFAARIVAALAFADAISGVYGTEPDGSVDDKAHLIAAVLRREALDPQRTVMVGDLDGTVHTPRQAPVHRRRDRDELLAAGADALAITPAELPDGISLPAPASPRAGHGPGGSGTASR